jgi:hypothetical protein
MTDNEFLNWMVGRLINVYNEDENTDFVLRLKAIADKSIGVVEENDVDIDHQIVIGYPLSNVEITLIKNKVMMLYGVDDEP